MENPAFMDFKTLLNSPILLNFKNAHRVLFWNSVLQFWLKITINYVFYSHRNKH